MKLYLLLALALCSCASGNFNHGAPHPPVSPRWLHEKKVYRFTPCEKDKVLLAYVRMAQACGCSECALYFLRCKHLLDVGPPDARGFQKRIRPRLNEEQDGQENTGDPGGCRPGDDGG